MDHAVSQILDAFKLVKELEHSLQNADALSNPRLLMDSCEAIAAAFGRPIPLLRSMQLVNPANGAGPRHANAAGEADGYDVFGLAPDASTTPLSGSPRATTAPSATDFRMTMEMAMAELGGGFMGYVSDPGEGAANAFSGIGGVLPAGEGSSPGKPPAAQRSPKKRKEGVAVITTRMPVPATGDKDTPPYDGYMWRKYGRKDILNSAFRRNYYRCAYKSYYGCRAKKYVQRLDEDPGVFEITYHGAHTCNTSPTPMSIPPFAVPGRSSNQLSYEPANLPGDGTCMVMPQPVTELLPLMGSISWLQRQPQPHERTLQPLFMIPLQGGEGAGRELGEQMAGSSSSMRVNVEHFADVDLADAMFNSGSSGNSMDEIFGSKHED